MAWLLRNVPLIFALAPGVRGWVMATRRRSSTSAIWGRDRSGHGVSRLGALPTPEHGMESALQPQEESFPATRSLYK